MPRSERLFDIIQILRDGKLHRAQDLATHFHVSPRTIYRDMDTLIASGVPVQGARGVGYIISAAVTLPPLTLSVAELEALNLGVAIVGETADPDLKAAAQNLAAKIDAVSTSQAVTPADEWKYAVHPFADATRAFTHMPTLRAAIRARQKVELVYISKDNTHAHRVIRPLHMEYWGRIWTLTAWCERAQAFRVFRVDLIETAKALPELFVDEPGKTLADYTR